MNALQIVLDNLVVFAQKNLSGTAKRSFNRQLNR